MGRRIHNRGCRLGVAIAVLGSLAGMVAGCTTTPPQSSTMVTFEKAVHFSAPDGADVTIPAGRYGVAPEGDQYLKLISVDSAEAGKAWSIAASPITVPVQLTVAAAVSLSSENDQHQVVWLRPNGSGLEAIGSYSGVITREAKCDAACQQRREKQKVEMYIETLQLQPKNIK